MAKTMEQLTDLIGIRKTKAPSASSVSLSQDFQGYELLLLRRLQTDRLVYKEWSAKLANKVLDSDYHFGVCSLDVDLDNVHH